MLCSVARKFPENIEQSFSIYHVYSNSSERKVRGSVNGKTLTYYKCYVTFILMFSPKCLFFSYLIITDYFVLFQGCRFPEDGLTHPVP